MSAKTKTKPSKSTITIKSIEVSMSGYDFAQLMKEHGSHLKRIQAIQKDVCQEYDNLGKPVPLFSQL